MNTMNTVASTLRNLSLLTMIVGVTSFMGPSTRSGYRALENVQPVAIQQSPQSYVVNCRTNTQLQIFDKMFEEEGPLGKGITVGKVSVALLASDRGQDSIFALLDRASMSSDDSSEGLAELCHEICVALLRKQDDWTAASSDSRWFSGNDAGKAESQYNEWSIKESAKFEKEYLADSSSQTGGATIVVVSLLLEIEGDNTVFQKAGFSRAETQKVLTSIASDVLVDEGQVVNAFEAFWTPGDGKEVLTSRDIIADFPELVTL